MDASLKTILHDQSRVVKFRPSYLPLVGDLNAALLLSQVVYWYSPGKAGETKLRVRRKGVYWIAKRRGDLFEELGLSPKQFTRACYILKEKELLFIDKFKFAGLPTVHLRLNIEKLAELITTGNSPKVNSLGNAPKVKTAIDQKSIPYTESTETESTQEISSGASATAKDNPMDSKQVQQEWMNKYKAKNFPDTIPKTTSTILAKTWRDIVPCFYDIGFMKMATPKEAGQWKNFMAATGIDKAYPVMKWAILNWGQLVVDVKTLKAEDTASHPNVGALLVHVDVAIKGYHGKSVQLTAPGKSAKTSKALTAEEAYKLAMGK